VRRLRAVTDGGSRWHDGSARHVPEAVERSDRTGEDVPGGDRRHAHRIDLLWTRPTPAAGLRKEVSAPLRHPPGVRTPGHRSERGAIRSPEPGPAGLVWAAAWPGACICGWAWACLRCRALPVPPGGCLEPPHVHGLGCRSLPGLAGRLHGSVAGPLPGLAGRLHGSVAGPCWARRTVCLGSVPVLCLGSVRVLTSWSERVPLGAEKNRKGGAPKVWGPPGTRGTCKRNLLGAG